MKVTNKTGLPMPIVKAVENDPYTNHGTKSVTTLLKPPQAYGIGLRHAEEMSEDAADRIWSLVGQVGHTILERAAGSLDPSKWVSERRYYAERNGHVVSGQVDLIHVEGGVVYDFKFTSGWAVIDARSGKSDWRIQLSMLAWLARQGGLNHPTHSQLNIIPEPIPVHTGKITAIVRDWSKSQALRVRDWPVQQVEVIDMNIMSNDEIEAWLDVRLKEFEDAEAGNWRPCTNEERWYKPGKWAVTKRGNQKASKLADTEEELSSWIFANRSKLGAAYDITERPAEYRRCKDYCAAAPFCQQFRDDPGTGDE